LPLPAIAATMPLFRRYAIDDGLDAIDVEPSVDIF